MIPADGSPSWNYKRIANFKIFKNPGYEGQ